MPVVVVRPGFIYGPRDRTVLPSMIKSLKAGEVRYLRSKPKLDAHNASKRIAPPNPTYVAPEPVTTPPPTLTTPVPPQ